VAELKRRLQDAEKRAQDAEERAVLAEDRFRTVVTAFEAAKHVFAL
jgi:hypothetical protein